MGVYTNMKSWVVDRQKAKLRVEAAENPFQLRAAEDYAKWLDDERPDWVADLPKDEEQK